MKKKLLVVSILTGFMLLAISLTSAINTSTPVRKKESPLYRVRTKLAIGEKISNIITNFKIKFIGERMFFLPFQWILNSDDNSLRRILQEKTEEGYTCDFTNCGILSVCDWCRSKNIPCRID